MSDSTRAALERLLQHIDDPIRTPFTREDAIAAGKAALAGEQGEGPSDEEWDALVARAWDQYIREPFPQSGDCFSDFSNALDLLRREIARWGHPAAPTDHRGVPPMIVSETGACDEPETERIICASISGGADYVNNMPRTLTLERINSEGSTYQKYIQDPIRALADHPAPQPPAEGDAKERTWPPSVATGCHEAAVSAVTGSPEQQLLVTAGNTIENLWQELHRTVPARPTPPAQGEVAELVAWLHGQDGGLGRRAIYARIAELLQQQQAEIQKLWTWLLACEGTANARAGGSGKPKWPAHALPRPQGEVQP